jgi:phosphotransferase system HPr-like phosphotransfer protein
VLSLGIDHGERVTLSSEAPGADPALDALVALLERDLDEE